MSKFAADVIQIVKNAWHDDFLKGIMVGIGCYIILVLLVHLLFIIFSRSRKCSSFVIPGENGAVIVSIKAVTGMLKQELAYFAQLEISRITIWQVKKDYALEIRGRFLPGNSGTPELYVGITNAVKEKMTSIFGISNVNKVDLRIESCKTEDEEENENTITYNPNIR